MKPTLLCLSILFCSCITPQSRINIASLELHQLLHYDHPFHKVIIDKNACFTLVHLQQIHYSEHYKNQLLQTLDSIKDHPELVRQKTAALR